MSADVAHAASSPSAAPPETGPAGKRINLSVGQLFVPDDFKAVDGRVNLIVHLHVSAKVAEQNLIRSGEHAVLVTVVLPGLSKVYSDLFAKPTAFKTILDETLKQLKELHIANDPTLGRVTVTSFSAGFGGVRELLKSEAFYQRINVLVMADSIHAGFVGDPAARQVDPDNMKGFLRFAHDAVAGKKVMIISHSQIKPTGYASTTETADYLLKLLNLQREALQKKWTEDWRCISQCRQNGFLVYGFIGDTGPEHMKHLYNLWRLMRLVK